MSSFGFAVTDVENGSVARSGLLVADLVSSVDSVQVFLQRRVDLDGDGRGISISIDDLSWRSRGNWK